MEEKKFPIYNFKASWNQDNFQNNGTSSSIMCKEDLNEEELQKKFNRWKSNIEKQQIEKGHPVIEWLHSSCEYVEHEVWTLYWFNHITYNQFETDEEVRKSFYNFIERKKELNRKNGHDDTQAIYIDGKISKPFYCLMGAEDEWRWKICRCEHCIAEGKIMIDH